MVVSKRCKVCAALDAENIPIYGECFGKLLPELILKISGIDLDPRKSNGVLICKSCAVQLVHTDLLVDKLRNTLQRLKKLVKEVKPKTPVAAQSKKTNEAKNTSAHNGELENLDNSEINLDESKTPDEIKPKTAKKVVRRKSVFPDDKPKTSNGVAEENEDTSNTTISIKDIFENSDKSETGEVNSETNLNESKPQEEIKPKTPKKIVRRKSVYPDEDNETTPKTGTSKKFKKILENSDNSENVEIDSKTNLKESKSQEEIKPTTPKKVVRRKSTYPDDKLTTSDNNEMTPLKKPPAKKAEKRHLANSTKDSNKTTDIIQSGDSDLVESTPKKRSKTKSISVSKEIPVDLTVDEQEGNISNNETSVIDGKAKVMNCSICGKVFHQKSALRDHIESNHMGERLKSCPHCSSEFRSLQKYESHVFSEKCKSTNHICQYPNCNKRFKTVHKMELHMHEKHSSQNESEAE